MIHACGIPEINARVMRDLVVALKDLNAIQADVKDGPSAEAALGDVQDIGHGSRPSIGV